MHILCMRGVKQPHFSVLGTWLYYISHCSKLAMSHVRLGFQHACTCHILRCMSPLLLFVPAQDPVWAEQAYVFPDWRSYSNQLADRAELASRHWLDTIAADTRRQKLSNSKAQMQQLGGNGKGWSGADAAARVARRVQELSGASADAAAEL
jgi:hypothetical protein